MNWKQPIPTGLESVFGEDYACNLLYQQLIYRAANQAGFFTTIRGKTIPIERGQTVFGRRQYGKYLGCDDSKCERNLRKLSDLYQKVSLKVSRSNCTIVTLLNYEELVRFEPQSEPIVSQSRAAGEPIVSTSKSVKSEKNEKNEKTRASLEDLDTAFTNQLATQYAVSPKDVETIAEELRLYCGSTGKTYKDYRMTLQAWVRRKLEEGKLLKVEGVTKRKSVVMSVAGKDFYSIKEFEDWDNAGRNLTA